MGIYSGIRIGIALGIRQGELGGGPSNLPPSAEFTFDVTDLDVDFTDESTDSDGTITAWDWDFDDGTAHGTTQHPSHTYAAPGTYTVRLTVTDDDGATHFVEHDVEVTAPAFNGTIQGYANNLGATTLRRWLRAMMGNLGQATSDEPLVIPFDMTLHRFMVKGTPGSADADKNQIYSVRKNGVDAVTLQIATNTDPYVVEDLVTEVSFVAGDLLSFSIINSDALVGTVPAAIMMLAEIKP